jgi:chemotaxis protein MotB
MATPLQPIIIRRKKGGHGAHHGGAWKVAYADFVTAMMALFIVLWLMNSAPKVQDAVSGYFKDPARSNKSGTTRAGSGESVTLHKEDMVRLEEKLQKAIKMTPELDKLKDNIEMTITAEGLRIELVETEKGMFFESGKSVPTKLGRDLLITLAQELGKLTSPVALEGHTESHSYGQDTYSNWELSSDRANAARRIMQTTGLHAGQVSQVRGFADQQLRFRADPTDPRNRRVSIIVQYTQAPVREDSNYIKKLMGDKGSPEAKPKQGSSDKAVSAPAASPASDKAH